MLVCYGLSWELCKFKTRMIPFRRQFVDHERLYQGGQALDDQFHRYVKNTKLVARLKRHVPIRIRLHMVCMATFRLLFKVDSYHG